MASLAPFPTIGECLEASRVQLSDMIAAVGGETLTDTQPFTTPLCNSAYQQLQEYLVSKGYQSLVKEFTFTLPAVGGVNPAGQAVVDWDTDPALPEDLIQVIDVWEAVPSGIGYQQMDRFINGLPKIQQKPWLGSWQWQNDQLVFIGATTDIGCFARYLAFLPFFTDISASLGPDQPVKIARSRDAMSWFITYQMCSSRGDLDAATILGNAQAAADKILQRDTLGISGPQKSADVRDMAAPQ